MSDQWADYLLSKVRYDQSGAQIETLLVHADNGDRVGQGVERTRQYVVDLLERDRTFLTIFKRSRESRRWSPGAEVRIVTIDGARYLRADGGRASADDLGELPRL